MDFFKIWIKLLFFDYIQFDKQPYIQIHYFYLEYNKY